MMYWPILREVPHSFSMPIWIPTYLARIHHIPSTYIHIYAVPSRPTEPLLGTYIAYIAYIAYMYVLLRTSVHVGIPYVVLGQPSVGKEETLNKMPRKENHVMKVPLDSMVSRSPVPLDGHAIVCMYGCMYVST